MTEQRKKQTVVLGIIGGIGSGKSFTTAEFVAQGAVKFDADEEVRKLYDDPAVLTRLKNRWQDVVDDDGKLDRQKLANIVFAPNEKGALELAALNAMIHPLVQEAFEKWLASSDTREFVILDAPLLLETELDRYVDYVVFVDACYATRVRRIKLRGWSEDEIIQREARQIPLAQKKARADFIVDASVDDSAMDRQVAVILNEIRNSNIRHSPPSL